MEGEDTANRSTKQPESTAKSGGRGAKNRRRDARAHNNNAAKSSVITSQAENRLGLKSTPDLLAIQPAYALRPTAVQIDLYACNLLVNAMITRMRTIAQRPLALYLAEAAVVTSYRKVCLYIIFARVCASQSKTSYTVGYNLPLVDAINAEQLRVIDARCGMIPNFLAWMLSHIGYFEMDNSRIIPTLPHPEQDDVTLDDALRGNYFSVCRYISAHRLGQAGVPIPEADLPRIPLLNAMISGVNTQGARFTNATVATYDHVVTGVQWDAFTNINGALNEQKSCVHDFKLTEAAGTEVPRIRFAERCEDSTSVDFYACEVASDILVRNALILRLGNDGSLPATERDSRFIMNRAKAVLSGRDVPAPYIQAQLLMITKLDSR